ncbi:MAG: glutamate--tRNA ligase family protein, partial [Candidatus Humimicrobiaceae bacterium]
NWFLEQLAIHRPRQIEFARLNLTYTIMSKRKLLELVKEKYINGWDDPRMPTLSGIRRRGYTPEAIRNFCSQIGMAKADSTIDIAFLEHFVREDLNKKAPRVMGVINPLKVVIDNYPEGRFEELDAINNPEDLSAGKRKIPFSKILYIEKEDFMEDPPKKFYRLAPGREVRLRYAYFIKCNDVIKDKDGNITELHCTYDPETKGGDAPDGRKVRATLHWVSAEHSIKAEIRLYDRLFLKENPLKTQGSEDYRDNINPDSLKVVTDCMLEPSLARAAPGDIYQFERLGYFSVDPDTTEDNIVFNRTSTLRDQWAKINKRN